MKSLLASAALTAIAAAVIFSGSESKDTYYDIPEHKVSWTLDKTNLPMMVFGDRALNAKHWRVDAATSMWALLSKDKDKGNVELLRLSATTRADGKGTRVHVEVLPPESSVHDQVVQGLKENGAYGDLYSAALAEQIDAKLTNRDFAIANISRATARVTLAALPHLRESFDNEAAEYDRRKQEDIDRVYANEK